MNNLLQIVMNNKVWLLQKVANALFLHSVVLSGRIFVLNSSSDVMYSIPFSESIVKKS